MRIQRLQDLRRFSSEKMQKVNVFESERFFCDLYCLEPGQGQKRHAHADADKVYIVLEGEANVVVGDTEERVRAGEAVLAPAGIDHGVDNPGPGPAVLLVYMAPHPDASPRTRS